MLIDARTVPAGQQLEADLCIVGAGAAGITIARELAGRSVDTILLESGSLERDEETQKLCGGEIVGQPYHPLISTRLRYFGGATNHWSGACRPLDPIDFEVRDWVPHSGWPFGRKELEPYYRKAQSICELGPFSYTAGEWTDPEAPLLPFETSNVETTVFQFSPPTRFGVAYRTEIEGASNIRTPLNANVTELVTSENGRTVTAARVTVLGGGAFQVFAKCFILAAGGIENARILLLSNRVQNSGIGNGNDLVGRFFMEHPHLYSGILLPINDSVLTNFYRARTVRGTRIQGAVALSEETLRREKTLGFAAFLRPWYIPGEESLEYITDALRRGRAPKDLLWNLKRVLLDVGKISEARCRRMLGTSRPAFWLHNRSEQSPNRESRVRLGDRRDALGQRTAVLDWRLNESDKRSLRRGHEILGMELGRAGLGRLRIEFDEGPSWPSDLGGGNHHMGTTRMHEDPKQGVVDANCRVRDLSNLYIAGSSVFPTVGFSNPTLTIVALSLRLAAHLRQSLGWS